MIGESYTEGLRLRSRSRFSNHVYCVQSEFRVRGFEGLYV